MTAAISSGAWFSVTVDQYRTKGATVIRHREGWCAWCGQRTRGPLSSLDAAMRAAEAMLAAAAKSEAA